MRLESFDDLRNGVYVVRCGSWQEPHSTLPLYSWTLVELEMSLKSGSPVVEVLS